LLVEWPPAWVWAVLPAAGFLLWTLLEYVLHSRFFHERAPSQRFLWLRASHGSHHEDPDDPGRIVARLSFSLPVAVALFVGLGLALRSAGLAGLVMVGVIAGYLSYEVIHFAIHRVAWARRVLRPLVSHHLHHHHADPSRCFGVTSPLWDWVFRTGRRTKLHTLARSASEG
jgi:sterol desaturase/sphingolipid hydroxylase (fatty acid hydroxylase superfamily)